MDILGTIIFGIVIVLFMFAPEFAAILTAVAKRISK